MGVFSSLTTKKLILGSWRLVHLVDERDLVLGERADPVRVSGLVGILEVVGVGSGCGGHRVPSVCSARGRPQAADADDGLAVASLGRVERGDGVVESGDVADVRAQPTITDPLDDLDQLRGNGLDDEVDRQTVLGSHVDQPGDGDQRSSRPGSGARTAPGWRRR